MIAVIDYGAGNLLSVKNALDFLGVKCAVTDSAADIAAADKVILPGVGAFGSAMAALERRGLAGAVRETAEKNVPLLGICLGLQLMFEESEESPGVKGLGIFKGKTARIPAENGLKIPHIGWNSIEVAKDSKILGGAGAGPFVYFVHSYYVCPEDGAIASAYTEYGRRLCVAAERGNIFAVQFHPEKSGEAGMRILKRFAEL